MTAECETQHTNVRPIILDNDKLLLLDQRKIPEAVEYVDATSLESMFAAIRDMIVRGAPAIGVAAALSLALEAKRIIAQGVGNRPDFLKQLNQAKERLQSSRPTAVNLRWATEYVFELAEKSNELSDKKLAEFLLESAHALIEKDIMINKSIGD